MPSTPTPKTVESRRATRTKVKSKSKKQKAPVGTKRAMVSKVATTVKPEDRAKAIAWAKDAAAKLASDPSTLGDKRKRLDEGVKFSDLKRLPARTPWQAKGSFGLLEELDDFEDDDIVPAWMLMQEMLDDMGLGDTPPPTKKHKSEHNTVMDEDITPINETIIPTSNKVSPQTHFNSHGNSASLLDLQPRSSRIASPIFDDPSDHKPHGNVFAQQQTLTNTDATTKAAEEERLDEEFARQQRIRMQEERELWSTPAGTHRYHQELRKKQQAEETAEKKAEQGMPKKGEESTPLWTQQPPPAPTPAHASLPTPLAASPSVPSIQPEEPDLVPATPSVDPVERQRAKLMKHTPARPSRLREATVPSPSVKSDAGQEPIHYCTLHEGEVHPACDALGKVLAEELDWNRLLAGIWPNTDRIMSTMPEAEPLDLSPRLLASVKELCQSDEYKEAHKNDFGGSYCPMIYSDEEIPEDPKPEGG